MHTHDELIACVPEADAETALAFLMNIMTTPPTWASTLPLDAEASYGKRYGDCK
jgi:DNA polymerase I-like protein with 3'-5' exonuclease and polymerase domains